MDILISLEDSVNLCMSFLHMTTLFDDYTKEEIEEFRSVVYSEMEQKGLLCQSKDPLMCRAAAYLCDINPQEIAAQIANDNLSNWCKNITNNIQIELINMQKSKIRAESQSDNATNISIG